MNLTKSASSLAWIEQRKHIPVKDLPDKSDSVVAIFRHHLGRYFLFRNGDLYVRYEWTSRSPFIFKCEL